MSEYIVPDYMQLVTVIVTSWHSSYSMDTMSLVVEQSLLPLINDIDYQLPYLRYHNLDSFVQDIVVFSELTETELLMLELKLAGHVIRVYTEEWSRV